MPSLPAGQTRELPDLEPLLARFGLQQFRPGQREVIQAVLQGDDCLCIMPTGGGKSLCYQLPAVAAGGLTLVVSPLIALMKDQVDALQRLEVPATYINSSLSSAEQHERLRAMGQGAYRLVYVAPERFRSPRFLDSLRQLPIRLLAVDEAHCISEWGHDFRHDYARLGRYRRRLGGPQTIALTATATQEVRADIIRQLDLEAPQTFVAGFRRPNLSFQVVYAARKREKAERLADWVRAYEGVGLVYVATRRECQQTADRLRDVLGEPVLAYHGGMAADERRRIQEAFMAEEARVVVATNAFGMGIDKHNVRFVIHYSMPRSLEAYYQEAGRAGRDGLPATCLLIYCPSDRYLQEYFIDNNHPPLEVIREIYEFLRGHEDDPIELTQEDLGQLLQLSIGAEGVGTCERLLEKCGVLERLEPQSNMAAVRVDTDSPTLVDLLPRQAAAQRRIAKALESLVEDRRYEWVYVRPQGLAERSGMQLDAVQRTLRELGRLDWLEYVPPFRGRAVHMLRRDLPFDALQVDYDELRRRREEALRKLDAVEQYARTPRCRQDLVLDYFGDRSERPCGVCDNCQEDVSGAEEGLAADDPVRQLVLKVLSGIARCQGRFGKTMVVGMLCGSRSSRLARWRLDRLSTFGLLQGGRQQDLSELVDRLVHLGLAQQVDVDRFRPVLQLTDRGTAVMRSQAELPAEVARWPVVARLLQASGVAAPRASGANGPPPRPSGGTEGAAPADEGAALADEGPPKPSYYWTWRLLADGYSVAECLAIRGIDRTTVLEHLIQAATRGCQVQREWVFPGGLRLPEGPEGADNKAGSSGDPEWSPLERQLYHLCSPRRLPP